MGYPASGFPSPENRRDLSSSNQRFQRRSPPQRLAPLGVKNIDMPLTPERVWRAIRNADNAYCRD
jgi:hypothetical protein